LGFGEEKLNLPTKNTESEIEQLSEGLLQNSVIEVNTLKFGSLDERKDPKTLKETLIEILKHSSAASAAVTEVASEGALERVVDAAGLAQRLASFLMRRDIRESLGRVFKLVVSLKIGARNHLTLMNRGDLSNEQWETLKPLLPPLKPRTGKPNHDHRQVVNGILWILRTGSPWRDLPERYGKWQSVATRFYRWQKANIWQQVLKRLQADADRQGKLDWEVHYVDGTVIRAHQHAAGGKKGAKSRRN
jgi:transposase